MKISDRTFAILTMVIYGVIICVVSSFHEVWRDEIETFSTILESHSLPELWHNMSGMGHPGLWNLILYATYNLWPDTLVLKITHVVLAMAASFVVLRFAPFSRWQKIIFLLGLYPVYAYAVVNRNYVLTMLLLFSYCAVYPKRFEKFWLVGIILFLMANAHAHALVVVLAILLSLAYEVLIERDQRHNKKSLVFGFLMAFGGVALSIVQIRPPDSSVIFSGKEISVLKVLNAFIYAAFMPGKPFVEGMGIDSSLFISFFIWAVVFYLIKKPNLFLMFSFSFIGLGMFFKLIYPASHLQHQGILFLLMTAAFWLDKLTGTRYVPVPTLLGKIHRAFDERKSVVFNLFLVLQLCLGIHAVKWDITSDFSVSKRAAQIIKGNAHLKEAILIFEPDPLGQSMPYYLDNPLYFPREGRFGKHVRWTHENKATLSLDELVVTARALRARQNRPVVICLGHTLNKEGPFEIKSYFDKIFTYTESSLERFRQQTDLVASLRESIIGEEYDMYFLK